MAKKYCSNDTNKDGDCHKCQGQPCMELECYEVYDGEYSWYAAFSKQDAIEQHAEEFYLDIEDFKEETEFYEIEDAVRIVARTEMLHVNYVYKTVAEWLENGRGFICSSSY